MRRCEVQEDLLGCWDIYIYKLLGDNYRYIIYLNYVDYSRYYLDISI
jgi:hypothetical protein